MKAKKFICIIFTVFFIILAAMPVNAVERKTVKIGFYSLPGFQNIEDDGTLSGYMYDYLQEIAKYTNWNYEYYTYTFNECLEKIKSGELDLISGMQKTLDRENEFLFPDYSCGEMFVGLYVSSSDTQYAYGDTESYSGMRVGIINGMKTKEDLENYCVSNNIVLKSIVQYNDNSNLKKALENGEIDAVCSLSTYGSSDLRCIAGFAYKNFYMMSGPNNSSLIKELDKALEYIKTQNAFYEQQLWERYVPVTKSKLPVFTKEEQAYIEKCGVLNAVYNKNWIPMEQYDSATGTFEGIDADVFRLISEMSSLNFNFIAEENYKNALESIKKEEISIICSTVNDYSWANKNGIKTSNEYLSVPIVMVACKQTEKNKTVVAMPAGIYLTETMKSSFPDYEYKEYQNYPECFEAILNGEADASIMNSYMASEYLKDSQFNDLVATSMYGYTYHFCVGFSSDVDPLLVSIVDKTLACISDDQITEIIVANTVKYKSVSASDLIYQNPIQSILVIAAAFLLLLFLMITILHNKNKYAKKLYALLNLDQLTGYMSSHKFRIIADELLKSKNKLNCAVIYLNIMRFKDINDACGYAVGDEVLKRISTVLSKSIGKNELFSRIYADRFALLLTYESKDNLEKRYEQIKKSIKDCCADIQLPHPLECKSGVYELTDSDFDINTALNYAGYAHGHEFDNETDMLSYYDESLQQKIRNNRMMEADMEKSLADGEFVVYYQPKFNSRTNSIIGAEALIRWNHSDKGLIPPSEFVPVFEKDGLITKIDLFVYEKVCGFLSKRIAENKPLFPISCNFSRLNFLDGGFSKRVSVIAEKYEVPHSLIEIEITETMAVENLDVVREQLEQLHRDGFRISIDDFGSGYSSLGVLAEIRFDVVKIDRSLVYNAEKSEYNKNILSGMAKTIRSLNKRIICEGVENQEQVDLLLSIGCTNIQGFFYSKPLCEKDFLGFVETKSVQKSTAPIS